MATWETGMPLVVSSEVDVIDVIASSALISSSKPRDFAYLHMHNSAYWTRIWPNPKEVNPSSERRTSRNCYGSVLPLAISAEESFHEETRKRGARDAWSLSSGSPTSGEKSKSMGSLTIVRHSPSTPFHDENVKNQAPELKRKKRERKKREKRTSVLGKKQAITRRQSPNRSQLESQKTREEQKNQRLDRLVVSIFVFIILSLRSRYQRWLRRVPIPMVPLLIPPPVPPKRPRKSSELRKLGFTSC